MYASEPISTVNEAVKISCDGLYRQSGTLLYTCHESKDGKEKTITVDLRSEDPDVMGYKVSLTTASPSSVASESKMIPRDAYHARSTTVDFKTSEDRIYCVWIDSLKISHSEKWVERPKTK